MSNNSLVSTYSRALGLKIGKPFINQSPYAMPYEKYITVGNGSGSASKNFSFYQEVLDFLWPYLQENNIGVVQLGSKDEPPIEQALRLQGITNVHQSAFIVKNAILHLGNDSMLVHVAGALETPVVGLYGPTCPANHGPFWKTEDSILLESHRNGKLPSFSFNENPRTIDMIKIEEVVSAVLKVLKIEPKNTIDSLYIGPKYGVRAIECVMDAVISPQFSPEIPLNIRYDYLENLQNLANQLSVRKALIITDKVINLDVLKALKHNVLGVAYEITDQHDSSFANSVRSLGIQIKLFTKMGEEKLNPLKLDYFDINLIDQEKTFTKQDVERHAEINSDTLFKSRKILLSNGQAFLSKAHWLLGVPIENIHECTGEVINTPKFFEEEEYFYIYNQKEIS